jgi:ribosomal protein S17
LKKTIQLTVFQIKPVNNYYKYITQKKRIMATLAEKLQLTLDCKNEIKTVMNENLGLKVTDSTPLSEYATKLKTVKV